MAFRAQQHTEDSGYCRMPGRERPGDLERAFDTYIPMGQQRCQIFRYAGIPTLQYGPSTPSGIHSYNETAEVTDVVNIAKVYLCTIVDFLNKK